MKIYKYQPDGENYSSFLIPEENWSIGDLIGKGERLLHSWSAIKVDDMLGDRLGYFPGNDSDFPFLKGRIPVFSQRASDVFATLLGDSIELLKLDSVHGDFYAVNLLNTIDALIEDESRIYRNRTTNMVSSIAKYSFDVGKLNGQLMFSIPQTLGLEVFVTDEFVKLVKKHNLIGLDNKLLFVA